MDGQKITKSHEDKAIIPCQLSLLTQILTISMSRQLPSLCVTAIEGSHAQMFTQLTKARFPPGQKIKLSPGFIFFEQIIWSYSSSNLKCAGLICIKQSQRAFDCPITKDCYQHTPSILLTCPDKNGTTLGRSQSLFYFVPQENLTANQARLVPHERERVGR